MKKAGKWSRLSRKKKILLLTVMIAGTGLAALGIYFLEGIQGGRTVAREVPIQEIQAEVGTVSDTIVGTGNLQYEEGSSVTIPSGIVVDEVNVEENDYVSQGDVLAVVNQVSVRRAMEDIQEELDELDEEIEDSKDDADSQSVTSKTAGNVKKIYVQQGQEIADCMAEHGALLLLSIDGSDDEEGTGDELAVTATVGTVEEVCVSEGDDVYEGTVLFKITNDGQSVEYQELLAKRQELVQSLQSLTVLSKSGVITAEADGIIKSVNISAQGSAKGTESEQDSQAAATVAKGAGTLQNTATGTGSAGTLKSVATVVGNAEILRKAVTVVGSAQDSGNMDESAGSVQAGTDAEKNLVLEVADSGTSNQELLVIESPKTGNVPQTALRAEDGSYQGQISWQPNCKNFAAETSYQACVKLTAGEGYLFSDKSITQVKAGVLSDVTVSGDGKELSFCLTYPFTAAEKTNSQKEDGEEEKAEENKNKDQEGTESEGEGSERTEDGNGNNGTGGTEDGNSNNGTEGTEDGNRNNGTGGTASGNQNGTVVGNASGGGNQSAGLAATSVSSQSSSQGSSSQGSSSQESSSAESTDSENEVVAFTMSSTETMILAVNVDELDINSVSEGQQAEITMDAMEDETFTGTVIKVGGSASSSGGGVAKYTVDVEIPGDERMKEGMNASATITIEKRENVVTIPVNALQERGMKVFVYTQTDSEGNLTGEQEVTTGLSDGSTVEITEGLSEGDKVYYQRLGSVSGQKDSQEFGGMEGGHKGNRGEMPGGEMPSGGMPGGGEMPGGGMPDNQ